MERHPKSAPPRSAASYRYLSIVTGIFITCLIISNIITVKIVAVGGVVMSAAITIFPISYIFGDILTEVYGYKHSRRVIWTGFACLALSAFMFWIIGLLPGEAGWQGYAGDAAYTAILGGMSSGGIVLASLSGYWTGSFTNSFVLSKMKVLTNGRWLWTRTLGSTLAGEFVDTVVFVFIASAFGVFPWNAFLSMTLTNYLFKCSVEALMTWPVTYAVVGALKRVENEDYYDRETNFNPFVA
jgi:uncharacterized integral membrane protein (TIGR00697 family)